MSLQKWIEAQKHEKRFWLRSNRKRLTTSQDRFYKILSLVEVNKYKDKTLLAIGSGPKGGILTFLESNKLKVAVDPLFTRNMIEMTSNIDSLVAIAEDLPIRDNSFDVVFCINALDHMADPDNALYEIFRVTQKVFLLMVHVVPPKGKALHAVFHSTYRKRSIMSRLLKTPKPLSYILYFSFRVLSILVNADIRKIALDGYAHPHYLTLSDVMNILTRTGFSIEKLKITPDISYGTFKLDLCVIARK